MTYNLRKARQRKRDRTTLAELTISAIAVVIVFALLYWLPPLG